MLRQVQPEVHFPEVENRILAYWRERNCFRRSIEKRAGAPHFLFYDGPPFATGLPHYGHLLTGTIKDIIPRYQTMKGRYVERRFGWDTHGLPVEMLIEQELNLNGPMDIRAYGVGKFNEVCRSSVLKLAPEWRRTTERLGRWVDFDHDYKTMDRTFMESVWWVFKQLWDQGRVYEGRRVMPYSWRLATPLSNFEAGLNYKEVQDPAVTVRFRDASDPDLSYLAWTTTPWTLISNMALCVNGEFDYHEVKCADGSRVVLAASRLESYFTAKDNHTVLKTFKGQELVGRHYAPLFPYFAGKKTEGSFCIVADGYVTADDGTGIVHQAPAYGEDDYRVCSLHGVPFVDAIDAEGNFLPEISEFQGQNIKEADKAIIHRLKSDGNLLRHDVINHSYPFCYRSDTPLIYRAISAWYVRVEDMRERMVKNNDAVHWIPEYVKDGRFGNWLAQARDWNISRNRFWGNPIPVWRCEGCGALEALASAAELEAKCGEKVEDLHIHFIDRLTWSCSRCKQAMRRVPEVLDCWFESGSMPYAQLHYPFESKELFTSAFPADFIGEGLDQTRGWFYTLMVISTALFDKSPFKNVIVNGIVLAEDGKKMSKRLKNYPDPQKIFDSFGADALRLYLVNSPVVRGDNLRLAEAGIRDTVRQVLLPLWNVYSFFTTYATVDRYTPHANFRASPNELDRWAVSRLQTLLASIEKEMAEYRLYAVVPALLSFLDELTNWYLRRSRRRFWEENVEDKQAGYDTLHRVLLDVSKALAPFLPFLSEEIYLNLSQISDTREESVHHCDYPVANKSCVDTQLEYDMGLIIQVVSLGRTLRARDTIKVRQPLRSITVITRKESDAGALQRLAHHIQEELNVKQVLFSSHEEEFVTLALKPNYPALGPIVGKEMKRLAADLQKLERSEILRIEDGATYLFDGKELPAGLFQIERKPKDGRSIETARGITVFFDTSIDPALLNEGIAREFINRIQRMRKEAALQVSDRIEVSYAGPAEFRECLKQHSEYIQGETLAVVLVSVESSSASSEFEEHEIDEWKVAIRINKVT